MPTTILIAEDEAAIADTVVYALRAEGYAAEHVLLGGEVLPRLRQGGIDMVILDIGLPDCSGLDVCRQLRMESEVPVLFLTARDGELDRVLGLELGGDVLPRLRRGGIDLVILDVGLPDCSGFDVCRSLRLESGVPVLFLTAR
ncbi:MAG: response regulator, partial [Thermomonas sp.]